MLHKLQQWFQAQYPRQRNSGPKGLRALFSIQAGTARRSGVSGATLYQGTTTGEGDDYLRGKVSSRKVRHVHGKQGFGVTAKDGSVIFPSLAGPGAWNTDSRMFNEAITLLP